MNDVALPAARATIGSQVARHPLLAFLLIAFALSWIVAPLDAYFDLGSINGFHILFGALPAFAASIIVSVLRPQPPGVSAGGRWRLWCVLAILIVALLALQRIWFAAGLITARDREAQPVAYPSLLAFLMDLAAAGALAWLLSGVRSPQPGVRELLRSLDPSRQPLRWYWWLIAVGLYPMVILLGNGLAAAFGLPVPAQPVSGPWLYLIVDALLMFLGIMVGAGGMEEPGWRGFVLPLLQKCLSPLLASLVLGLIWTLWHLPLLWFGVFKGGPAAVLLFAVVVIPLSVLFTAVFNRSGGSLLAVILLHTSFNAASVYLPISTLASELWLFLILVIAAWMLRWPAAFTLRPASRFERSTVA